MRHLVPRPPRPPRTRAHAALFVAVAALAAAPLHAQSAGPQFTDEVLRIDAARIAQLVAGLDAEAAARPAIEREHAAAMARYEAARDAFPAKIAQYEKDVAAWQARMDKYEACEQKHVDGLTTSDAAKADQAKMEQMGAQMDNAEFKAQLEKRMKDLAARMQAAQARGDQAAMMALADSVQRVMAPINQAGRQGMAVAQRAQGRAETAVANIRRECGENPEPARPKSPKSPNDLLPAGAWEQIEEAGAKGAKLSRRQYAVLKERVGAYLALKKHGAGIATQYAFAPSERAALDAAHPGLARRPEVLDW